METYDWTHKNWTHKKAKNEGMKAPQKRDGTLLGVLVEKIHDLAPGIASCAERSWIHQKGMVADCCDEYVVYTR